MKPIGTLDRIGQDRGLVRIEPEELPSIGATVVDQDLTKLGTVVDVIGPTVSPWAVVMPGESVDLVAYLGDRLYERSA